MRRTFTGTRPCGNEPLTTSITEEHARETQGLDTGALEYLPDGIFTCQGLAGSLIVTYANRGFRNLLGFEKDLALDGRSLVELLGERLGPHAAQTLERAVSTHQRTMLTLGPADHPSGFRLVLRPTSSNGDNRWVGSLVSAGESSALQVENARLVSKASGEREQEPSDGLGPEFANLLRQILDATPALMGVRDLRDRYVLVNSPMGELFGLQREDFLGKTWDEIQPALPSHCKLPTLPREILHVGGPVVRRNVRVIDGFGNERELDLIYHLLVQRQRAPRYVLEVGTEVAPALQETARTGPLVERLDEQTRCSATITEICRLLADGSEELTAERICEALGLLGELTEVDHCWLRVFYSASMQTRRVLRWSAAGAPPPARVEEPQDLAADYPWVTSELKAGRVVLFDHRRELPPEAQEERRLLQAHGVAAFLSLPVMTDDQLNAALELRGPQPRQWTDVMQASLATAGLLFAGALVRLNAQRDLLRAQLELKEIARQLPGAIVQWALTDQTQQLRYVSEGIQLITGYTQEEISQRPELLFSGTDANSKAALRRAIEQASHDLSQCQLTFPLKHRNGNEARWLKLSASARPSGDGMTLLEGSITDVTEQTAIVEQLQAAENRALRSEQAGQQLGQTLRRLEEISKFIPGALYRCEVQSDGAPKLTFLSEGARRIFGLDPAQMLCDPGFPVNMIHPDDREGSRLAMEDSLRNLNDLEHQVRIRDGLGEVKWIRITARPRKNAAGGVVVDGVVTDVTAQRVAEQALAQTRNQLQRVISTIPGVVYQLVFPHDGRPRFVYMSEGWRELFGVEPELVKADPETFLSRVHPADRREGKRIIKQAVSAFEPYEVEFRLLSDGRRWIRVSGKPVRKSAKARLFSVVAVDITELKQASAAVQSSQRQLQDIIRTIPGVVFQCVAGPRPELVYLSEGARTIFGVEASELLGPMDRFLDHLRQGEGEGVRERLMRLAVEMQPWDEEFRIVHAGISRWVKLAARPVRSAEGTTYYHGVISDITDAKLYESRLADSERRLELALENGGLALLDWHIDEDRVIYNRELARIVGKEYEELGTSISTLEKLEHPSDGARKRKELTAHLEGSTQEFRCEYRLLTSQSRWRWVQEVGRVVERGSSGQPLRYVGTIQDVSERIEAERRLEHQVFFSRLISRISSEFVALRTEDTHRGIQEALSTIARFTRAKGAYLCERREERCVMSLATLGDGDDADLPDCEGNNWLTEQMSGHEIVQVPRVEGLPDHAAATREALSNRNVGSFLMVPLFLAEDSLGFLGFEFAKAGRVWSSEELGLFRVVGETISQAIGRERRERKLRAVESQVQEITRAMPGVVCQAYRSPRGKLDFRFLSGAGLLGIDFEAAVNEPDLLLNAVDRRDRRSLEHSLEASARELTRWEQDFRVRTAEGGTRWVSAYAHPRRLPDGGTLFNGIAIDATDRKKAEKALQASERRLRELYDSTPVMMHSTDPRGRITSVNDEWLATLGYELTQVLGRRTEDFMTRASRERLKLNDLAAFIGEGIRDMPCRMVKNGGELIDVLISARLEADPQGDFVGANVCLMDVTERNRALAALEESQQRYRTVVQDQTEVICRFNRTGALQFVNDACVRLAGRPAAQLKGTSWYELLMPNYRNAIRQQLRGMAADTPPHQYELRMRGRNSDDRWYQWTIRGVFGEDGKLTGYQAVGRDIQELKALEKEIREISHREQERIGHDLHDGLGQELTGISLMLKSLEQSVGERAPDSKAKVGAVRDMVNQSIATTRALAQGLSPVHLERDGFAGALGQLAANTESVYGVPVSFEAVRKSPVADRSATTDLYRIAQEALNNAAKHSAARQISVKLVVDRELLTLEVADDGKGMATTSDGQSGMGLRTMRYRASMIGASLDILPGGEGGTVVRCLMRQVPQQVTKEKCSE